MRSLAIALIVLMTGCASYHEDAPAQDIARFADRVQHEIPDIPSMGVAVVSADRVIYLRNADTAYYIGSTTKAYTGLACAILANRKAIDLDAPVSKYLPEVNLSVPLRAFLTHTAGIKNDPIVYRTAYTGEHTPQQLVLLLNQSKPIAPGFEYDNLGYVVASLVIERVTGKPWQQALDELVFAPLGMAHTTAYMSRARTWKMAKPYQLNRSGEVAPSTFEKVDETMHAAGGIVTTPADLARWLQANLTKGRIGGRQVIPAAAFDEAQAMRVPVTIERGEFKSKGYAFGWYHADFHGEPAMFHGGGYEGWHTQFALLPERPVAGGVFTNVNGPMDAAPDLVLAYAFDRVLGRPDLDAEYAKRLDALKERVAKSKQGMLADVAKRAQRPWSLQHPNAAYVGRYENPAVGTLVIEQRGDALWASLGRLSSLVEPFTKAESARVELVPGSGRPLLFQWGAAADKPDAVIFDEDTFTRIP